MLTDLDLSPLSQRGCALDLMISSSLLWTNRPVRMHTELRVHFRVFLALVFIGAAHGLILMPVLLSLLGPPAFGDPSRKSARQQQFTAFQ